MAEWGAGILLEAVEIQYIPVDGLAGQDESHFPQFGEVPPFPRT